MSETSDLLRQGAERGGTRLQNGNRVTTFFIQEKWGVRRVEVVLDDSSKP